MKLTEQLDNYNLLELYQLREHIKDDANIIDANTGVLIGYQPLNPQKMELIKRINKQINGKK